MKKSILIFCAVIMTFSLMAFGYMNLSETTTIKEKTVSKKMEIVNSNFSNPWNTEATDIDLIYNVESRFIATITKADLDKARSIVDILPQKATESVLSFEDVRISILSENNLSAEKTEEGENSILTIAQISLLQSVDYSTNIRIECYGKKKNLFDGKLISNKIIYYMTITPTKEAQFVNGYDALIEYLKENSQDKAAIIRKESLKPGKVYFTITKEGDIANVELNSTSGYPSVDKALVEMITNMPEKWEPATNSKGEKVNQKLVFFFGLQGC